MLLTSTEMVAITRAMSALHIAIDSTFRYLSGNSDTFSSYGFKERYKIIVLDAVENSLLNMTNYSKKILDM